MYLGNKQLVKGGLKIIGGYKTKAHKKSGGFRIDQSRHDKGVNYGYAPLLKYVGDWPNTNGDGTRYGAYDIVGMNIREIVVHGKNFVKGTVRRNQKQFDVISGFGVHRHYFDKTTKKHIKWLDYLDPAIRVSGIKGVTTKASSTRRHLPGTQALGTRHDVIAAYKKYLGRDPESELVLQAQLRDLNNLGLTKWQTVIKNSPEAQKFRQKPKPQPKPVPKPKPKPAPKPPVDPNKLEIERLKGVIEDQIGELAELVKVEYDLGKELEGCRTSKKNLELEKSLKEMEQQSKSRRKEINRLQVVNKALVSQPNLFDRFISWIKSKLSSVRSS
ncbi:MAG TPA: hypothetical protein ENI23_01320 [bacterium]|nr:hypothetical protein [bacterium]